MRLSRSRERSNGLKQMATASLLVVAAEAREFAGVLKHCGPAKIIKLPDAQFAREILLHGRRVILLANGPGPRLVNGTLQAYVSTNGSVKEIVSTGFCGALNAALQIGDIVISGADPKQSCLPYIKGEIWSEDRVVTGSGEKRRLRENTGADIVEMEFAAVLAKAREWHVPCRAVRVVSDIATEDLPLDFNRYRDRDGRFQTARIAAAGLARPFTVLPALMRLGRNSRVAAEKLGAFFANCEF